MTDCNLSFNPENDCRQKNGVSMGKLTNKAMLRLHPDRASEACKERATKKFVEASATCKKGQNFDDIADFFDNTLLGPKGLLSKVFRNTINVPTYKEAKAKRARIRAAPKSKYTQNVISILDKALKAVYKKKTREGQINEILKQMQKLSREVDKKQKGAKLFQGLVMMAEGMVSPNALGGGRMRRRGASASRVKRGGVVVEEVVVSESQDTQPNPEEEQQIVVNTPGVIRDSQGNLAVLQKAVADRYTILVEAGKADTPEAQALFKQIIVLTAASGLVVRQNQYLKMQWVRWLMPYIVIAGAVLVAAGAAYALITMVGGAAGIVTGLFAGVIGIISAGLLDIVLSSYLGYLTSFRGTGHEAFRNITQTFGEYAGDDFAGAAAAGVAAGLSAQVTGGIILFLLFLLMEAMVYTAWSGRGWSLGYGAIRVEGDTKSEPNPYTNKHGQQLLGGQLLLGGQQQQQQLQLQNPTPGGDEPVELNGGGRRRRRRKTKKRRRRKTKKRRRRRKGRSRKRVTRKIKRRCTKKRRNRGKKRRTRSRR